MNINGIPNITNYSIDELSRTLKTVKKGKGNVYIISDLSKTDLNKLTKDQILQQIKGGELAVHLGGTNYKVHKITNMQNASFEHPKGNGVQVDAILDDEMASLIKGVTDALKAISKTLEEEHDKFQERNSSVEAPITNLQPLRSVRSKRPLPSNEHRSTNDNQQQNTTSIREEIQQIDAAGSEAASTRRRKDKERQAEKEEEKKLLLDKAVRFDLKTGEILNQEKKRRNISK